MSWHFAELLHILCISSYKTLTEEKLLGFLDLWLCTLDCFETKLWLKTIFFKLKKATDVTNQNKSILFLLLGCFYLFHFVKLST